MAIYLERGNQDPYSSEELNRVRDGIERDGRFVLDRTSPCCYFREGDNTFYAIQLIPNRIQVSQILVKDRDPIIPVIIDLLMPSYYLDDSVPGKHPIDQLR